MSNEIFYMIYLGKERKENILTFIKNSRKCFLERLLRDAAKVNNLIKEISNSREELWRVVNQTRKIAWINKWHSRAARGILSALKAAPKEGVQVDGFGSRRYLLGAPRNKHWCGTKNALVISQDEYNLANIV